jgi:DNA invertase Pin-like site-specific DNA recombinase
VDSTKDKNVVELIRVSTEQQAGEDRAGIPAQRETNRRTAKQYGLSIVRTVELTDVSGAAILQAPEIKELLRLMESPEIHGIVTREFSRLMRPENFSDYALLQAFVETNTVLYLPEGPIDLASKNGRLLGTIRAAIAGLERTEILERVWAAKEEKRRAGKHPQSWVTLPYGVGYDSKRGWHHRPEAAKVKEAFRLFLSGETSYRRVGRKVQIDPFNLRIILRNPIYTGWRVIDKRRDPSPRARRTKPDGRQADRPKIPRAPSEVIRVKVLDPLVSKRDFDSVQSILDLKRQKHWRVRPDYEHRFTYNGFLMCGACGNLVYTHVRKPHDWYVCKSRTTTERRARQQRGLTQCFNPYMRRETLEPQIDRLFSERLQDPAFLEEIAAAYQSRFVSRSTQSETFRLQREMERLQTKRQRVLESYFDGLITRDERDTRLESVDRDTHLYRDLLLRCEPAVPELTPKVLAEAYAPFYEWGFLTRSAKRRLLRALVPEIHVEDYRVAGITMLGEPVHRYEISHTGRGSSPPPAPAAPGRSG